MKLSDLSTGPDWELWIIFIIFIVISAMLISGRGGWLISGYNTASKEEKSKYDEKKLCRVTGIGMAIIAVLILVMGLFQDSLPANFAYISIGIILIDVLGIMIIGNFYCKK